MPFVKIFYFAVAIISVIEISQIACNEFKVIETSDGAVRGIKNTTWWKNVEYYSFRGIPYASKPIGNLRFKAPKPIESWKPKILDAFDFGNICVQLMATSENSTPESEDCLYLNVFVPADIKPDEKLPVLIYTHGGYFKGSGNYVPDFILDKRVILVTFNYRLGIFGFLSLNLPEYSGNMGLKDQQLAIKWIHKNIEYFNGDNSKITLTGHSFGSISAHFQILSAESRKYFQNAILMSGTGFVYLAMSENSDYLEIAYDMAKSFGKPAGQPNELVNVLLAEPSENIMKFLLPILSQGRERTMSFLFTPVIERHDAVQPLISESIEQIYDTHDINVTTMFIVTTAEMLYTTKNNPIIADIDGLNTNFSIKLPFRGLNLSSDSEEYRSLNNEIREFYFGNDVINVNKSKEYVALLSDLNYCYAIDKTVKLHASKSKGKTFYAQFAVDSKLNGQKKLRSKFQIAGASHADDLYYLLRFTESQMFYDDVFRTQDDEQSKISIQTIEHMTDLFTKFPKIERSAFSGIEFKPIQNGEINFLNITNEGLQPGMNPNAKAMEFWMKIENRVQNHIRAN